MFQFGIKSKMVSLEFFRYKTKMNNKIKNQDVSR
jgi:hypothetical protein